MWNVCGVSAVRIPVGIPVCCLYAESLGPEEHGEILGAVTP